MFSRAHTNGPNGQAPAATNDERLLHYKK